jgi:hypothetical protein
MAPARDVSAFLKWMATGGSGASKLKQFRNLAGRFVKQCEA